MTALTAGAAPPMAAARSASAAQLAARIPIPRSLPPRYDGQPLRHLSHSSYTKFLLCPEDWRRHYLLGERFAPSGPMFLGNRVDGALSTYYRHLLEHGEPLNRDQIRDAYRELWARELASERDKRGIDWSDELDEPHAFQVGLDAIDLTLRELVPRIGRPVAVQRKLEFKLTPDLEWTVQCYLDLETLVVVDDDPHAVPVPAIVDYKVKGTPLSQGKAAQDPQAGLYLAARWLHHDPAAWFAFAQIAKPGKRRKQMSAAFVRTTRTPGQLRGCLARVAQAASEIVAYYQRFGPDRPWGFADPTGWKCSHRYCHHHPVCPGGRGL